jgi:hypothetical protein
MEKRGNTSLTENSGDKQFIYQYNKEILVAKRRWSAIALKLELVGIVFDCKRPHYYGYDCCIASDNH